MAKAKVSSPPVRYKGIAKEIITGMIRRPWADMPPDAQISTDVLVDFLGINRRTLQRHYARGLLSSPHSMSKLEAERYLRVLDARGGVRMGRPRKNEQLSLLKRKAS